MFNKKEHLSYLASVVPKKNNFKGLTDTSYLAKIVSCLELDYPDVAELKNRYWYDSLEEKFTQLGHLTFVVNWFENSYNKKTPELGKAFLEVNLNNLYHLSLLCSYTERYGVPFTNWFRKACIDRANDSLYTLPEGNLLLYQLLTTRANSSRNGKRLPLKHIKRSRLSNSSFNMSKIQNAAALCGRHRTLFDAHFKHQVLEQALLKKTVNKSFIFSSKKLHPKKRI